MIINNTIKSLLIIAIMLSLTSCRGPFHVFPPNAKHKHSKKAKYSRQVENSKEEKCYKNSKNKKCKDAKTRRRK